MKKKYQSMGGLEVKDGRLVNDRPTGKTGICQMAEIKKGLTKAKKAGIIADGIELSDVRKNFYGI